MSKKRIDEWTEVKGLSGVSVIGDADRFSISIRVDGKKIGFNGCRIVDGKKGKFISFPAWKDNKGEYHDYAFLSFDDKDDAELIIRMF